MAKKASGVKALSNQVAKKKKTLSDINKKKNEKKKVEKLRKQLTQLDNKIKTARKRVGGSTKRKR